MAQLRKLEQAQWNYMSDWTGWMTSIETYKWHDEHGNPKYILYLFTYPIRWTNGLPDSSFTEMEKSANDWHKATKRLKRKLGKHNYAEHIRCGTNGIFRGFSIAIHKNCSDVRAAENICRKSGATEVVYDGEVHEIKSRHNGGYIVIGILLLLGIIIAILFLQ